MFIIFQDNIVRKRALGTDNSNSNPSITSIKVGTIQNENPDRIGNIQNKKLNKNSSTQTEEHCKPNSSNKITTDNKELKAETVWNINNIEEGKSIADQVKEVAQSALQQSGMVYVESAGMYYDYKTGYYYNSVSILFIVFHSNK